MYERERDLYIFCPICTGIYVYMYIAYTRIHIHLHIRIEALQGHSFYTSVSFLCGHGGSAADQGTSQHLQAAWSKYARCQRHKPQNDTVPTGFSALAPKLYFCPGAQPADFRQQRSAFSLKNATIIGRSCLQALHLYSSHEATGPYLLGPREAHDS